MAKHVPTCQDLVLNQSTDCNLGMIPLFFRSRGIIIQQWYQVGDTVPTTKHRWTTLKQFFNDLTREWTLTETLRDDMKEGTASGLICGEVPPKYHDEGDNNSTLSHTPEITERGAASGLFPEGWSRALWRAPSTCPTIAFFTRNVPRRTSMGR